MLEEALQAFGSREDAEDVLIQTLLQACQHMHQLNDPLSSARGQRK